MIRSIVISFLVWGLVASTGKNGLQYPSHFSEFGYDWTIDQAGNLYVVRANRDANNSSVYVTAKYDREGRKLWERSGVPILREWNRDFVFAAIAVDHKENPCVVCYTPRPNLDNRLGSVTTKYDYNGKQMWSVPCKVGKTDPLILARLAIDNSGNIYVTGRYSKPSLDSSGVSQPDADSDIATIKYAPDGRRLWTAQYRSDGDRDDCPMDTVLDHKGNLYIVGFTGGRSFVGDLVTIKYDTNGRQLWASCHTEKDTMNMPEAATVDGRGNVYVAGSSAALKEKDIHCVTIKYNADGKKQWVGRYKESEWSIAPNAIAIDQAGNVIVTGQKSESRPYSGPRIRKKKYRYKYLTIKYNDAGKELWVSKYEGPAGLDVSLYDLVVDKEDNIYVIGYIDSDALIIKYDMNGDEKYVIRLKTVSEFVKFLSALSRS